MYIYAETHVHAHAHTHILSTHWLSNTTVLPVSGFFRYLQLFFVSSLANHSIQFHVSAVCRKASGLHTRGCTFPGSSAVMASKGWDALERIALSPWIKVFVYKTHWLSNISEGQNYKHTHMHTHTHRYL